MENLPSLPPFSKAGKRLAASDTGCTSDVPIKQARATTESTKRQESVTFQEQKVDKFSSETYQCFHDRTNACKKYYEKYHEVAEITSGEGGTVFKGLF